MLTEQHARFLEHGVGYEYTNGEIIRIDSQYVHAEVVRPALRLMHDAGPGFAGPLEEFLGAHERYRRGDLKDAVNWVGKAFESTLKAICVARSWRFDANRDGSKALLDCLYANGLVPTWMQNHLSSLRAVLESGVSTPRNKSAAAHGQGATPSELPEHLARYVMHLTASNIVFLIESHNRIR